MPFRFCPQCGTKLQPEFRFCPSCGEKLLCPVELPEPSGQTESWAPSQSHEIETFTVKTSPTVLSTRFEATERHPCNESLPVSARPPLRQTRKSSRFIKEADFNIQDVAPPADVIEAKDNAAGSKLFPPKQHALTSSLDEKVQPASEILSPPVSKSPRRVRGKARTSRPVEKLVQEGKELTDKTSLEAGESNLACSPVSASLTRSSPATSRSPLKGRGKAKKAKHMFALEPLEENEEVTDTTGKKWKLVKLISQSMTELFYEVFQAQTRSSSKEINYILKLGAKDGRIFNEQNFLQRSAKPSSVDKWVKNNKMDFLGIPSCVGFGLHGDSYRFLVFPDLGQSLESLMQNDGLLSEKVVLQLACRILDVLEYIHSNEYVHADLSAENIYVKPSQKSQVYLVGYCYAFRYCPGGQHVEYREASRTPHEGTVEFISLDAHKGAAPSRRSDLQSLGYCMLRWHSGMLPWTEVTQPDQVATQKQRYMDDVPALLNHCFGKKSVTRAFQTYLTAVMALQYSEQPDYLALKDVFRAALLQLGGTVEQLLDF
ncbi:inactive serine/threonine-protein kinase VRK3 isoform X1 [Thalassophryne amazonica]|uniref:inactive serine/threonine-protein kinase VRK3 isoform X1 n=1 Tax=Thalassophryne amazonica TaxID=390379 RepID=UPI0014724501|nr:inactive serine/threonine-protein kinase VRK3 isoform X1 [Thalassophryne amazonica]